MKYKVSFIMVLLIFQTNMALSFQASHQRYKQVIREISELFPQDRNTQYLLDKHLSDHNFLSSLENLMNRSTSVEFLPYIEEYEVLKGAPIRESIIAFFAGHLARAALCRYPFIFVDIDRWQILSEDVKRIVLFHELGHCDLMRGHESEETFSIMSEQNFFITIRPDLETGELEERVVLNSKAQENLEFLYGELFSKGGNFSVDIQLWIQESQDRGMDISNILRGYVQNYLYNFLRIRY